MKNPLLLSLILALLCVHVARAQDESDDFSRPPALEDFKIENTFDSTAQALVLSEIGNSSIEEASNSFELQYDYKVRIKILNEKGINESDVQLILHKNQDEKETVSDVSASSFNIVNGAVIEQKLNPDNVYTVNKHEYANLFRFAIPGAQKGSIIQYHYILHTRFYYMDFHSWLFQTDIPKIKSTYTVHIPAYLNYHASLKGVLPLSRNTGVKEDHCLVVGGLGAVDCSKLSWEMKNIPAFREEKYVTGAPDYQSKIEFELASAVSSMAYVEKISQTWKDVDRTLRTESGFGGAIRRSTSFFKPMLDTLLKGTADSVKAVKIYKLLRQRYTWNDIYGKYSEISPKTLWELRKGLSSELNLSLIGALRAAGLDADPMLITLRSQSTPRKLFPVLTDFSTVIASLNLNGKRYLLDITNKYMPFGMISEQFLCHEGRLFPKEDSSRWAPVDIPFNSKSYSIYHLSMAKDGTLKGTVDEYGSGYKALEMKEEYGHFTSDDDYLDSKTKEWPNSRILSFKKDTASEEDLAHQQFQIEISNYHKSGNGSINFSAFLAPINAMNGVFNTNVRLYPLDFGYPIVRNVAITITLPEGFKVKSEPQSVRLKLANNGGSFAFNHALNENEYQIGYGLSLLQSRYSPAEFYNIKELFSRMEKISTNLIVLEPK